MCVKQSLKSPMWQKFSHIFCNDKKVQHVVSYIISRKCIHTHDTHEEVQISSNTNAKLANPSSPVSSQLK